MNIKEAIDELIENKQRWNRSQTEKDLVKIVEAQQEMIKELRSDLKDLRRELDQHVDYYMHNINEDYC